MIKVTREQMEVVKRVQTHSALERVLEVIWDRNDKFLDEYTPLNDMTVEQIVLAWHGHVEVEPEFVSFDEAMKALRNGKAVFFRGNKKDWAEKISPIQVLHTNIRNLEIGGQGLLDLLDGKWTIEGDNK